MRALATVGNVNLDLILGPLAPWPQPGTEVILDHDDLRVGGAAGNAALAWQGLGLDFTIAASIGNDSFGQWLAAPFGHRAAGWTVHPTATTVSVGITHPGDERTFLTTRGHLPHLGWSDIRPQLPDALAGGLLLLCGSNVTPRLAGDYGALFDWAAARGIEVALDTGWPVTGWTPAERDRVTGWLSGIRHLLLNEIEVTGLTGTTRLDDALRALPGLLAPGAIAVVKVGPQGAIAVTRDDRLHISAPAIAVRDTIGAGDVFNAGYLAALAQGAPLAAAVGQGIAIAATALSTRPRRYTVADGEAVA